MSHRHRQAQHGHVPSMTLQQRAAHYARAAQEAQEARALQEANVELVMLRKDLQDAVDALQQSADDHRATIAEAEVQLRGVVERADQLQAEADGLALAKAAAEAGRADAEAAHAAAVDAQAAAEAAKLQAEAAAGDLVAKLDRIADAAQVLTGQMGGGTPHADRDAATDALNAAIHS